MAAVTTYGPIVFFDGVCNLCNNAINFLIRNDHKKQLLFCPLQSERGKVASEHVSRSTHNDPNSIIFLYKGEYFVKSSAALRILSMLGSGWIIMRLFLIVPRILRDGVYDLIARNRHKWFGTADTCMVPTPELQGRFLD